MDWLQQFEIIKDIASKKIAQAGGSFSLAQLDRLLGVSQGKSRKWANGQRPSADDLELIARKLEIPAKWLLLNEGDPYRSPRREVMERGGDEYIAIADTLREMIREGRITFEHFAEEAGITPDDLQAYLDMRDSPSGAVVARWVHRLRINANFLLAQVGQPYLTEREYMQRGPLNWLREKRGDFYEDPAFTPDEAADESHAMPAVTDPIAQRMRVFAETMREAGLPAESIAQSLERMAVSNEADENADDVKRVASWDD